MLEVSNLSRSYGSFKAVDDVSFSIGQGEIVGLLGHNGAGKTTIMRMLSGYLEPDAGEVVIDGKSLCSETKDIQSRLGYLPESLPVYPEMEVADYLDYAADLKGVPNEQKSNELRRIISETDLKDKLLEPISSLSRGYKQRVGVAQAVIGKPSLLILDEPTNGLDPTQTEQMRTLIRDLSKSATVILSTHIMQEVEALCDRVLILRQGKVAVDAKLSDLRESKTLLLCTSLDSKTLGHKLQEIEGVRSYECRSESEFQRFWVTLEEEVSPKSVAATIAKLVVELEGDLFTLQSEQRDLETLFRQVNQSAEVPDAA